MCVCVCEGELCNEIGSLCWSSSCFPEQHTRVQIINYLTFQLTNYTERRTNQPISNSNPAYCSYVLPPTRQRRKAKEKAEAERKAREDAATPLTKSGVVGMGTPLSRGGGRTPLRTPRRVGL